MALSLLKWIKYFGYAQEQVSKVYKRITKKRPEFPKDVPAAGAYARAIVNRYLIPVLYKEALKGTPVEEAFRKAVAQLEDKITEDRQMILEELKLAGYTPEQAERVYRLALTLAADVAAHAGRVAAAA